MSDPEERQADPAEVEPTDNSIGEPVDMNKVEEIEEQVKDS